MIQHEDGLVHQLMTGYLTTQGFLFAAFGVVSGGWLSHEHHGEIRLFIPVAIVLVVISVSAFALAFHTKDAVDAAVRQIDRIVHWWMEYSGESLPKDDGAEDNREFLKSNRPFPPIIGRLPKGMAIDLHILRLSYAWSALFAVVIGTAVHRGCFLIFDTNVFPSWNRMFLSWNKMFLSWCAGICIALIAFSVGFFWSRVETPLRTPNKTGSHS
jgi:hypothetical protein